MGTEFFASGARKQKTWTKMECIGRMTARIESLACKDRKTNEIWLLGEVSESGTLNRSKYRRAREALARQHRLEGT
jgi:hypothetical protein